ncbi:peroxiredoxin family protein [Gelidibacter salicanalis]|uniref:AhpC/TSA family protein n=1 Tax=Gelidibacter salicanalis TaxID=291193 RepID=A0A934KKU7_9FLAO|nr:TlpA disulfide reductase family protein [Gelidibacter salicanalis]MBJ7879619.1 AhpC/TSA family protein [Gelidibacter salicanalis]
MRVLSFSILILISISCNQEKKSKFSLIGTTNELKNETVLYLLNPSTDEIVDSVQVHDNSFYLTTILPTDPFPAILKNKDNSLYKILWLEDNPMTFNDSNQDFGNAVITGSDSEIEYSNLYKAADTLPRKEREKLLIDFIKTHSDNILGPYVLAEWYISWKKERTEPLYNLFSEKNKNSLYGKEIYKYIRSNQNPKIGEHYVDFEIPDQYGRKTKLSEVKGKLILLEFWASWCAPCRTDNANLVTYYDAYKPLGFEIFQVSLDDDKEEWLEAIKQDNLQWNNVSHLNAWKGEAAMIYGINLLPSNYLIDEDGIIISQDLRGQELEQKIKEILE